MKKMRIAVVVTAVILTATSSYLSYDLVSEARAKDNDRYEVELSNLSEADIDIIVAVKERMEAVIPASASAD